MSSKVLKSPSRPSTGHGRIVSDHHGFPLVSIKEGFMFALLRSPKSQSPWCTLDIARKPSMTRGSPRQFGNLPRVWELLNIAFFF